MKKGRVGVPLIVAVAYRKDGKRPEIGTGWTKKGTGWSRNRDGSKNTIRREIKHLWRVGTGRDGFFAYSAYMRAIGLMVFAVPTRPSRPSGFATVG